HVFLAEVMEVRRHARGASHFADGEFVFQAVHPAIPRAQGAAAERLERLVDLLLEAPLLVGLQVCGREIPPGHDEASVTVDLRWHAAIREQHHGTPRSSKAKEISEMDLQDGGGDSSLWHAAIP